MPLRRFTGAKYAASAWLMADDTVTIVPLAQSEYDKAAADGTMDRLHPPAADARFLIAFGGFPALDTVDGMPHPGDYWEAPDQDEITGKPITVLHVQTGDDPMGNWWCTYTTTRKADGTIAVEGRTGAAVTESSLNVTTKHRDVFTNYVLALAAQIIPTSPTRTVNWVKKPTASAATALGS